MTHKCCEVVVYGLALVINDYQHCKSPLPPPHTHKQTNLKNNGLLNMAAHAGNTIYSRHWLKDYANSEFKCRRLLLLLKCYNLYKVLACSTTFFQVSLLCATFFQLLMFIALYIFHNVFFPTCFRSSNWSFRHWFSSLNLLHNTILIIMNVSTIK